MANTFSKPYPNVKSGSDRDGLKKVDTHRQNRSSVRNKLNHLDYDLDEFEYEDEDLISSEKM